METKIMEDNLHIDKDISTNEVENPEVEQNTSFSFSQLLKDAGKQAIKAVKWLFISIFSFSILNILFLLIALFRGENTNKIHIILTLVIGVVIIVFAFTKTYRYILIDALSVAYRYLTPLFKKISIKIINIVVAGGNKITGRDINKSLNVGSLMLEIYGKKAPGYVQKGLQLVLNIIPFGSFLTSMQKELSEKKNNKVLSEILYKYMDEYIINSIFKENTMKWMLWLLLANIVIQIGLIILF